MDMAKVNTLIWPYAEKKTHGPLAADYDVLYVADKIGIVETEPSWLNLNINFFSPTNKQINNLVPAIVMSVHYLLSSISISFKWHSI